MPPYDAACSRPYTLTEVSAVEQYTTTFLPVSITIPLRSRTPFAGSVASYSIYSAFVGVPVPDNAILTSTVADVDRLVTLMFTIDNVLAGTVYTVVFVVPLGADCPKIPDAILNNPLPC
jgi:uncharacterized membrane protein